MRLRAVVFCSVLALAWSARPVAAEPLAAVRSSVESGKAVLVDVRETSEWDDGHLRDARPLPLSRIQKTPEAADGLPRDRPVYVHCVKGTRARKASEILKKAGIDARPLDLGYVDLRSAGFVDAPREKTSR